MSEPFIAKVDPRKLDAASKKTGIPIERLRQAKEGKLKLTPEEEKSLKAIAGIILY